MRWQEKTHPTQELEHAKLEFIDAWESGKQATLQEYITRYPQFAEDLADFILTFIETESAVASESEATHPSVLALRALERARAVRGIVPATAPTIQDLAKAAKVTMARLVTTLGLPNSILLPICRGQVLEPTQPIVRTLAQALQRTEGEIRAAFSVLISSQTQLSGNHRATSGHLEASVLPRMTFRQLIEESTELTEDQKRFWLEEPDGKE
jgi:transcriptional regulator with XRE-family HTH domain